MRLGKIKASALLTLLSYSICAIAEEPNFSLPFETLSKQEEPLFETTANAQVISGMEIKELGLTNVFEAIDYLTNNYFLGFENGYPNKKLVVLLDDTYLGSTFNFDKLPQLINLPSSDIQRIEITRDSGGILHGEFGTDYVINIITKKLSKNVGAKASVGTGNKSSKDISTSVTDAINDENFVRGYVLGLNHPKTGFYENNTSIGFKFQNESDNHRNTFDVNRLNGDNDLLNSSGYLQNFSFKHEKLSDEETVYSLKFYGQNFLDEATTNAKVNYYNLEGNYFFGIKDYHHFSLTGKLGTINFDSPFNNSKNENLTESSILLLDKVTIMKDKLFLIAGAGFEKITGAKTNFYPTLRIGYQPYANHFFWAASSYTKYNFNDEDYLTRCAEGGFSCVINPDLKPKSVKVLEAGYRGKFKRLSLDLNVFTRSNSNSLFIKNATINGIKVNLFENTKQASETGVNFRSKYKISNFIYLGYDLNYSGFRSLNLDNSISFRLEQRISSTFKLRDNIHFKLSLSNLRLSDQTNTNHYNFNIVDSSINYSLSDNLKFSFIIKNLTYNKAPDLDPYNLSGRTIMLKFELLK